MPYKPPYTINSKMINTISSIMKYIGQLSNNQSLNHRPLLRKTNKIRSVYASLAIENNSLSKKQVTDIINGKTVIGPKKDIIEVQNAIKVYDLILDINPFDSDDLLKYHALMMNSLIADAGMYRKGQEGVFDGEQLIFAAPQAKLVPTLIDNLFDYLNNYEENMLIKSCVFHYEFEFIHPFSDGNGRMGRLFQTCLLASSELIFAYLPVESIIKERQQAYYEAISTSHKNGNSDVFIQYMLEAILETIKRLVKDSNQESSYLNIQAKKLYHLMEEGIPYTTKELMQETDMKSRASFKKHYLDPNLDAGLVEMTFPDKPSSRNQRYIKK